jgi:hypothetical protein
MFALAVLSEHTPNSDGHAETPIVIYGHHDLRHGSLSRIALFEYLNVFKILEVFYIYDLHKYFGCSA